MTRWNTVSAFFQGAAAQEPGTSLTQIRMPNLFKDSSRWSEDKEKQWQEELVWLVEEQYLPCSIVDVPFRSMIQTLNNKASIPMLHT